MKDVISVDTTGGDTSYKELVEKLATIEHERWSDWQRWVHTVYENPTRPFEEAIKNWKRQIDTPYDKLSEREKQSDREQVQRYLPLLHSLLISKLPEKKPLVLEKEYSTPRELLPQEQEIKLNTNHQVIGFNQAVDNMNRVIDEMFRSGDES